MNDQNTILDYAPDGMQKPGKVRITSDVTGSYTGRPEDPNELPVQDADDL